MGEQERKVRDDRVRREIAEFLKSFSYADEAALRLLIVSVGGVLFRAYRKGETWQELISTQQSREDIGHVVDWLKSSILDGADWLGRVDADGRPLKLTKMSTLDQIVREADKAMVKSAQRTARLELVEGDEEMRMELDDGFSLVRMLTPQALDRESGQMQHCVGHGAYDGYLSTKNIVFYSLRDRFNKPHATIQVDLRERSIVQLQGKQNTLPHPKYMSLLPKWLTEERIGVNSAQSLGFMQDSEGRVHHFSALPDGVTLVGNVTIGDLRISAHDTHEASRLPNNLRVTGDLTLKGSISRRLPAGLTVDGDLYVRQATIEHVSPEIRVAGDIHLEGSHIAALPEEFETAGGLNIENATIGRMPTRLVVGGELSLRNSTGIVLPVNLSVGGSLNLAGSDIDSLPENLEIGGALFMGDTKYLEVLPKGLKVGGNVATRACALREISEGTRIGGGLALDLRSITTLVIHPDVVIAQGITRRDIEPGGQVLAVRKITLDEFRATQTALLSQAPKMQALR